MIVQIWHRDVFAAKNVSTESKKYSDNVLPIVRILVFIEYEQISNTVVANDSHTITETIRFLLTMHRHSGTYFSPAVHHTLILPSQYTMLNLDSPEKKVSRTSCLVLSSWRF